MERLFRASTSFGPFTEGHLVLLDDQDPVHAGWIHTGYLHEIKAEEPASADGEGAHRAG